MGFEWNTIESEGTKQRCLSTEEIVGEAYGAQINVDFQILQGRGRGAKEEGGSLDSCMLALDDQGSRSCDVGSEVPKHIGASW